MAALIAIPAMFVLPVGLLLAGCSERVTLGVTVALCLAIALCDMAAAATRRRGQRGL